MEIKVKLADEKEVRGTLPDISYDRWLKSDLYKSGSSDIEYDNYLRENKMIDLTDFNSETTGDIELIVEQEHRGRVLKFKCVYDSDNDESFNEREYFKQKHGKFNIQEELYKILDSFGFKYIHTLNSYEHYFETEDWQVLFNPDEEEFFFKSLKNSDFYKPASLKLDGDDLTLSAIKKHLRLFL